MYKEIRKKLHRYELINMIMELAGLPQNTTTDGYFSRKQLLELIAYIKIVNEKLKNNDEN